MSENKIVISEFQDATFGNLIKLTNGLIELMVTLDFGPRIIHFSRVGMDNIFYQDKEAKPLGDKFEVYGGDIVKLYGGHRLWASPELLPSCYYPDNFPVSCTKLSNGNGIEVTAPVEKFTHVQKSITIELSEKSEFVSVSHRIENCGAWGIEIAPWSITMLAAGGKEVMPQSDRQTGFLHNRSFSFWDYSKMNDPRIYYGADFLTLTQDPSMTDAFKLGYNNEKGWAAYFNKDQLFIKSLQYDSNANYPDNGCNFETYTCAFMLEMETLGALSIIKPNESIEHMEKWQLHKHITIPSNDDIEIGSMIKKYTETTNIN
jgi:hypothetical protein